MAVREYIGARYVPVFADPLQWDNERTYEPLTMVQNEGETYISRTAVPIGIEITNENYWVFLTDWNAQVEQYRNEVLQYNGRISDLEDGIPIASFDDDNTVKDYIDAIKDTIGSGFTSEDTVKDAIDIINANGWVTDNRIADKTITLDKLANGSSSIGTKMAANYLGTLIYGPGNISYDTLGKMHAGDIASNGTMEVVISCPFTADTQNRGSVRFINVINNQRDILGEKIVTLGHAQSITWDSIREKFVIVPLYDTSSGTQIIMQELWLYDSTFTNRTIINTGLVSPSGCAFDHVTNKLYIIGTDDKIYEVKSDNSLEFMSNANVTSQALGLHVQGFAVRNNIWYRGNTIGNIAYGYIGKDGVFGNADVEKYDTASNYILFGELNGFDFTPDGNLICLGDYSTASINSTITQIFEIITPSTETYIHYLYHPNPILTSCFLNPSATTLRQLPNDTNSPVQNPIMFNFIQDLIGANLRINLQSNFITTDNVQLNNFAVLVIDLQGHTFQCATLRYEGAVLCVKGNGTSSIFKPDIIQNYNCERTIIHLSNILFKPQRQEPFSGVRTGSMLSATTISNPDDIKFPTESVGHVIPASGFMIAANSIYLNNTILPS